MGIPVAVCCVQLAPWSVLMNRPTGSGAPPVPWQRRVQHLDAAGGGRRGRRREGDDGLAEARRRRPIAAATAGVAALRICVQFWPPSVERNTPRPLMPAYRMRAPAGEDVSSDERAGVAAGVGAGGPVEPAVGRAEAAAGRGEVDDVAVGRIDDDDVDPLVDELGRVPVLPARIAGAEQDPACAAVGRLEQARLRLRRDARAGADVDDVGVVRIDRERARLADAERELPVEQRRPRGAAVVAAPSAAAGRAHVDDVGVRRIDRDGRREAVHGRGRPARSGSDRWVPRPSRSGSWHVPPAVILLLRLA